MSSLTITKGYYTPSVNTTDGYYNIVLCLLMQGVNTYTRRSRLPPNHPANHIRWNKNAAHLGGIYRCFCFISSIGIIAAGVGPICPL